MTITPDFELSQTDSHIILQIRVPHVRVSPEQVQVVLTDDNTVLHFASPPYLLVLNFAATGNNNNKNRFHEAAEESCAQYDPTIEHGMIRLELRKETPGVRWDHLDLLGRLAPTARSRSANIKTTTTTTTSGGGSRWLQSVERTENDDAMNHENDDTTQPASHIVPGYGFLRLFHGIYSDLVRDGLAKEMLELPWEESSIGNNNQLFLVQVSECQLRKERRRKRCELERSKFSPERYLGDLELGEDYIYQCAMAMKPHWVKDSLSCARTDFDTVDDALSQRFSSLAVSGDEVKPATSSTADADATCSLTPEERRMLLSIPYPLLPPSITAEHEQALLVGLLDILFAYVYDHLMTGGDPTVESAWTISMVSASLACLEDWFNDGDNDDGEQDSGFSLQDTVSSVVRSSLRRALVYPYLRNWDYGLYVWRQVIALVGGRAGMIRPIVRSLLQTRSILERSELYYMGNKLLVDPYLSWLQANPSSIEEKLLLLSKSVESVLDMPELKDGLDLDLRKLEASFFTESGSEHDDDDSSTGSSGTTSESGENDSSSDGEGRSSCIAYPISLHEIAYTVQAESKASSGQKIETSSSALLDENLGSSGQDIALVTRVEKFEDNPSIHPLIQEL